MAGGWGVNRAGTCVPPSDHIRLQQVEGANASSARSPGETGSGRDGFWARPKGLSLVQREHRPGGSALRSSGLGFMQTILRRLWSLALYKPTVENQPRNRIARQAET